MKRGPARTGDERTRDAERGAGDRDGTGAGSAQAPVPHGQLRFGWWALLFYLVLGALLEGLHAFKVGWYLDASSDTRRLLWTLAHAHGTLLAIVNVLFALSVPHMRASSEGAGRLAGRALIGATIALPCGFLLGGAVIYEGDPGIGILLVPVGAILLFAGVFIAARGARPAAR